MRKINILLILLTVGSSLLSAQEILSDEQIKDLIKKEVDQKRSPSIVVGIADESGSRVISCGKLDKKSKREADGNTLYEIGSITKVFTSLLLEDMAEHGELDVHDPISKFLPKSVKTPARDGREITLIDLSTQTSGLPRMPGNFAPKDYQNPFSDYTPEKLYEYLSTYKLTRGIGEKYEYSNTGVGLLGHILSISGKKDYEDLVRSRITIPLNMTSTVITLSPEMKGRLATGYDKNGKAVKNWTFSSLSGAGALLSTVNDMLIFLSANLGFVKTPLTSEMRKTHAALHSTDTPGLKIGMAWHIWEMYGKEILWHNGGTGGYRTFIGFDKENKRGIVVFSNSANGVDDIGLHLLESRFKLISFKGLESIIDLLMKAVTEKGVEEAISIYTDLRTDHKDEYDFGEDQLNSLGYQLLEARMFKEATEILRLNAEMFPDSFNVYDSLGEAYLADGNIQSALENYKKSVERNPENTNSIQMIEKLKNR